MKEITKFYKRFVFNFKNKINLDIENVNNKSLNELFNHFGTDKGTKVLDLIQKNLKKSMVMVLQNFMKKNLNIIKIKN